MCIALPVQKTDASRTRLTSDYRKIMRSLTLSAH